MFKFSLCFATLAGLIFLLRGDDDEKQEKKRKTDKVLTQDLDYDDYEDYEDEYFPSDSLLQLCLGCPGIPRPDRSRRYRRPV